MLVDRQVDHVRFVVSLYRRKIRHSSNGMRFSVNVDGQNDIIQCIGAVFLVFSRFLLSEKIFQVGKTISEIGGQRNILSQKNNITNLLSEKIFRVRKIVSIKNQELTKFSKLEK